MSQENKNNNKWVILGFIVVALAILVAVGPFLLRKYMVSKWQNAGQYKNVNLMMNVQGQLKMSNDIPYLIGNNEKYYVLENVQIENLQDYVGKKCSVIGKIRRPKNNEKIDGNDVRFFIDVDKINIEGLVLSPRNINEKDKEINEQSVEDKYLRRARLRVEVNTILNKSILFDVIKGKVSSVTEKNKNNEDVALIVLTNEFNDKYILYRKGKDLSSLENKEIICLGREIITPKEIPLIIDNVTFEIYEVYDYQYNKLM